MPGRHQPEAREGLRVVVVGPLPEPHNGMTVVTETILSSSLCERFSLLHVDTSDHRSIGHVGRLDLVNVLLALRSAFRLAGAVFRPEVDLVYLPIAKHRLAFLRDALFLLAVRASRRPTVVHLHARGFDEFWRSQPRSMRRLIRACLTGDRVHAVVLGEGLRTEFAGLIPDRRVYVLPNGSADLGPSAARADELPTVLYLSTLWKAKGLFDLLEAAVRLRRSVPNVHLLLAGDWYSQLEAEEAERFIAAHDLGECVRVCGPVGPEAKRRVLAEASVLALPSHSEGQPLVVLEALSAGLPVVSTRVGAIPEAIDDDVEGFLVDVGDIDALTERITTILEDPARRARMSRAARERYERDFTADRFADGLAAIWWDVARGGTPDGSLAAAMEAAAT